MTRYLSATAMLIVAGAVSLGCVHPSRADDEANLALHRPYTMSPAPSYDLTTDVGDQEQLTDGRLTLGIGRLWRYRSTVGWQSLPAARITIDLGSDVDIGEVSAHTGAGTADVAWPGPIFVFVGERADEYRPVGGLEPDTHPTSGYSSAWYRSKGISVRARYVTLLCLVPNRQYLFFDEVQVAKADGRAGFAKTAPVADLTTFGATANTVEHVRRRIEQDLDALLPELQRSPLSARSALQRESDSIRRALQAPYSPPAGFVARLPLSPLHRRVFQLQASIWRARGISEAVWPLATWARSTHILIPPQGPLAPMTVDLARGTDRRALLVGIASGSTDDRLVRVCVDGLDRLSWTARAVEWTDRVNDSPVASALAEPSGADGCQLLEVTAGLPGQIWFTFGAGSLSPSIRHGSIKIFFDTKTFAIPLTVTVFESSLSQTALHTGGFDYSPSTLYDVRPTNRTSLVSLLRDHLVDSAWASHEMLGLPGSASTTDAFARWTRELWPHAARYMVFADIPFSRPPAPAAVKQWLTAWRAALADEQLPDDSLWVLLSDEPKTSSEVDRIGAWSGAIRAAGGGIRLVEDPTTVDSALLARLAKSVDVLVANRKLLAERGASYLAALRSACVTSCRLGLYNSVADAHALDPYRYYRLQAWIVFRLGGATSLFWSFADDGGFTGWNDYNGRGPAYSPIFLSVDRATSSKQLEALREGIEDFEVLTLLQRAVVAARTQGLHLSALAEAESLLSTRIDQMIADDSPRLYAWQMDQDRTQADQLRVDALRLLDIIIAAKRH